MFVRVSTMALALASALAVAGCGILGSGTANTSRRSSADVGPEETGGIGVNAYLWRAALDTLDFLPIASADPYGGVIITDWYANPEAADERLKATVYILDTRLRADGISASVFREKMVNGAWTTAVVTPDTNLALENAILSKARQLRLSTVE
jgi:hypothetical protein